MASLEEYAKAGQSIWLDFIKRSFIRSGELKSLVDKGLRGATSNPTIVDKAIASGDEYDGEILELSRRGMTPREIFFQLMLEDVGEAADVFRPVYDKLNGLDGFQSIEVSPEISDDADAMVEEAIKFVRTLSRPNIMVKIPATKAGLDAIRRLTAEGVNVNVTLIFSVERYKEVVDAYIAGLEEYAKKGGTLSRVSSVASFFVSRVDTAVDKELQKLGKNELMGKAAVANAKEAYSHFKRAFSGDRWLELKKLGANVQRPLWASTSTKNPAYPDTMYVDNLVGPDTVNTVPPQTLEAILDHGKVANTLDQGLEEARNHLRQLSDVGVDMNSVTENLLSEGVRLFSESVQQALKTIEEKAAKLNPGAKAGLAEYRNQDLKDAFLQVTSDKVVQRIWSADYTLWKNSPDEIVNRLGWLSLPKTMPGQVKRLKSLVGAARALGVSRVLLLGMGGSSLAPRMYSKLFSESASGLKLSVLDSTDPGEVIDAAKHNRPSQTLYIVSSKSGGTVETISLLKYFYNLSQEELGTHAGEHFVAITDPGTELEALSRRRGFLDVFLANPDVGGRYSALTFFGLVPAALAGVDLDRLLKGAATLSQACASDSPFENPGLRLGCSLGKMALQGRDKLTLVTTGPASYFADWVEQLVAESTGKDGRGILPVVRETLGKPSVYGPDRLFVHVALGDDGLDGELQSIAAAGHPVVDTHLRDVYDVGGLLFTWEFAVAVAGYFLKINPFDQPNVEASKELARRMVADYLRTGRLSKGTPLLSLNGIQVYGDASVQAAKTQIESAGSEPLRRLLGGVLDGPQKPSYVGVQAYIKEDHGSAECLEEMRLKLRDRLRVAVTLGYGPRFLHSTGQLHKGDAGRGVFLQLVSEGGEDCGVPDELGSKNSSLSFGVLKVAQAMGDMAALQSRGRRVVSIHFDQAKTLEALKAVADSL